MDRKAAELALGKLTDEKKTYYVYMLVDPRTDEIFYVGKGTGPRVLAHEAAAEDTEKDTEKIKRIKDIIAAGQEVKYYILRSGIVKEQEAFLVESMMIDFLTHSVYALKADLKNIQGGHHAQIDGIRTLGEVIKESNIQLLENIPHRLIAINVNKQYLKEGGNLYEAVRSSWRLSQRRANQADYIVAEYRKVIRGIFKVNEKGWVGTLDKNGKIRYEFEGTEVTDKTIQDLYLNRRIESNHGNQNPIHYLGDWNDWKKSK